MNNDEMLQHPPPNHDDKSDKSPPKDPPEHPPRPEPPKRDYIEDLPDAIEPFERWERE